MLNLYKVSDITQQLAESPAAKMAEHLSAQEQRWNKLLNPTGGLIDSLRKHEEKTLGNLNCPYIE